MWLSTHYTERFLVSPDNSLGALGHARYSHTLNGFEHSNSCFPW